MTASTPEILETLLQEFVSATRRLPGLHALYLEGSLALGGFNEHFSDIDFIALLGPEPQVLPFNVDWDIILRKMHQNMSTYWASWTRRPDALLAMLTDWAIQWTVLSVEI